MRLTDLALLWLVITLPMQWTIDWQLQQYFTAERAMTVLEHKLQTAADDAAFVMSQTARYVHNEQANLAVAYNGDATARQFYRSIANLLPSSDMMNALSLQQMLLVIDEDGYLLYKRGEREPKRFFSATDRQANVYLLAMNERMRMFDRARNRWLTGTRAQLSAETGASILHDEVAFTHWKKMMMTEQLERDLHYATNGIFKFSFPRSWRAGYHDAEFGNMVAHPGIVACVWSVSQHDETRAVYALATAKIVKKTNNPPENE